MRAKIKTHSIVILIAIGLISATSLAGTPTDSNAENVVFITLDGVRWQDVFNTPEAMTRSRSHPTWNPFQPLRDLPQSFLFGDHSRGGVFSRVSNHVNYSLPAYQTMFLGKFEGCIANNCPEVKSQTLQEHLIEQGFAHDSVISLASWQPTQRAFERNGAGTLTSAGISPFPLLPGLSKKVREGISRINDLQARDLPTWDEARKDQYTQELALLLLKEKRPRFLYVGLLDPDNWAHKQNSQNYAQSLVDSVSFIKAVQKTLADMGAYGNATTLIVTTDHGRGDGEHWNIHGEEIPESANIWIFAQGPHVSGKAPTRYEHIDLRPTIENILGVAPGKGLRGRVLQEITGIQNK